MANITTAQVQKYNEKMSNNWKFDLRHFYMHSGEKQPVKVIKLNDTEYIEAQLWFSEKYQIYFRQVGLEIHLHIGKLSSCGNIPYSKTRIPYSKTRKSFADLQKLTKVIDDKYIMDIYNSGDNAERCADNILLDKDGWHIHEV